MKYNDGVIFEKNKEYKFIQEIGQGGTGRTILMNDETIDETFVCKKLYRYDSTQIGQYKLLIDSIINSEKKNNFFIF